MEQERERKTIQIAAIETVDPDLGMCRSVYALQNDGSIFVDDYDGRGWTKLKPIPQD